MSAHISALWPLNVALAAAIEGDATLDTLLAGDKVYNAQAPEGSPLPYITFGFATESSDNVFGAYGTSAGQQLDIWTRNANEIGNREAFEIYGALYSLLHEQPLAVTGFGYVIGTLSLIAITVDADGQSIHAIARYEITQRQAG